MNVLRGTGVRLGEVLRPLPLPGARAPVPLRRLAWLWLGAEAPARAFPRPLISYIRKFYYYDPQEEVYLSLKEAQLISKQKQETESST